MKYKNIIVLSALCFTLLAVVPAKASDPLLSLKNLERERASFISLALSESQDISQKQAMAMRKLRQLSDMERMVIRDDRLLNQHDQLVSRAFKQFELTFLVHASAEANDTALTHWFNQIGFSTQAILSAKPGFRK